MVTSLAADEGAIDWSENIGQQERDQGDGPSAIERPLTEGSHGLRYDELTTEDAIRPRVAVVVEAIDPHRDLRSEPPSDELVGARGIANRTTIRVLGAYADRDRRCQRATGEDVPEHEGTSQQEGRGAFRRLGTPVSE
jgi:hypothetical protein